MAKRRVKSSVKISFFIIITLLVGVIAIITIPEPKKNFNSDNKTTITNTTEKKKIKSAKLTLVGDLLFESPFYQSVKNGYDANNYFKNVKDYFFNDDLSIGNMEVVVGDDTLPVSGDGYNFCAPRYIGDLVSSLDFQILSTVNNHSYDRGLEGLVSTINYFKDNTSIKTVGTYLNDDDKNNYRVLDINGIKFGFLAYTYGTNMRINSAERNMVSVYRNPDTRKFDDIAKENIKKEVLAVKNLSDIMIVMMHWGNEFTFEESAEQQEVATFLNELGVDIVYGSHSHSIQPIKMIGDTHKTLVYYSLGNFVSNDDDIARTPKGQETFDNAYQFGLLSTFNVIIDENKNISFDDIKTEPIVNYFDTAMNNWSLIPFKDYTEDYEKSHFRYSLGLTKDFINSTYTSVIDEQYR